jgi:hypothetical protein
MDLIELGFRLIGINIYMAERDLQPGTELSDKLKANIDASDALLVLYTAHAATSKEVNWEIGYAQGKKNIFFIAEWGVEKPVAHQGQEHFPLERTKLVDCICSVCSYFKPYSGLADARQQATPDYEYAMLTGAGNSRYKFRIKYPAGHDLAYCPEFVTAEGLCATCNLMLQDGYDSAHQAIRKCPACRNYLYSSTYRELRAKTISEFIRGEQWKRTR